MNASDIDIYDLDFEEASPSKLNVNFEGSPNSLENPSQVDIYDFEDSVAASIYKQSVQLINSNSPQIGKEDINTFSTGSAIPKNFEGKSYRKTPPPRRASPILNLLDVHRNKNSVFALKVEPLLWWVSDAFVEEKLHAAGINNIVCIRFIEYRSNGSSSGTCIIEFSEESDGKKALAVLTDAKLPISEPDGEVVIYPVPVAEVPKMYAKGADLYIKRLDYPEPPIFPRMTARSRNTRGRSRGLTSSAQQPPYLPPEPDICYGGEWSRPRVRRAAGRGGGIPQQYDGVDAHEEYWSPPEQLPCLDGPVTQDSYPPLDGRMRSPFYDEHGHEYEPDELNYPPARTPLGLPTYEAYHRRERYSEQHDSPLSAHRVSVRGVSSTPRVPYRSPVRESPSHLAHVPNRGSSRYHPASHAPAYTELVGTGNSSKGGPYRTRSREREKEKSRAKERGREKHSSKDKESRSHHRAHEREREKSKGHEKDVRSREREKTHGHERERPREKVRERGPRFRLDKAR
ncbi:cleavage and polyadenylation specificity factor subunit 6-like [Zophobas morio]|uniref:cleavage and polyadenylation specificity factor subunit 6-like n=1 Tax=Zophobas morio TaxID=2755281 RepID=UPI003082BB5F